MLLAGIPTLRQYSIVFWNFQFGYISDKSFGSINVVIGCLWRRHCQSILDKAWKSLKMRFLWFQNSNTILERILGCFIKGDENMLIYEYFPNISLGSFILEPNLPCPGLFSWPQFLVAVIIVLKLKNGRFGCGAPFSSLEESWFDCCIILPEVTNK